MSNTEALLKELLKSMTEKDITALIKGKEKKVEEKKVYKGKVTYHCLTCANTKKGGFTSNIEGQHIDSNVPTCKECRSKLFLYDKELLIEMILFTREGGKL